MLADNKVLNFVDSLFNEARLNAHASAPPKPRAFALIRRRNLRAF